MQKYIVSFILVCVLLVSCEQDPVIFDQSQTLIEFENTELNLFVEPEGTGSVTASLTVSSSSESERSFSVSLIADETTADPESYSFASTIVVPANSYIGTLTINGVDNNVEIAPKPLVLRINEGDDFLVGPDNELNVNVRIGCAIDETLFTGSYLIEQTSTFLAGPSLSHNTVIELKSNGLERSFETFNFPNFCSITNTFVFNLVCNEFLVPFQFNNCNCNDGVDYFGPAIANGIYDVNDDSEFTIIFTEDTKEECGAKGQTSYRFIKQ